MITPIAKIIMPIHITSKVVIFLPRNLAVMTIDDIQTEEDANEKTIEEPIVRSVNSNKGFIINISAPLQTKIGIPTTNIISMDNHWLLKFKKERICFGLNSSNDKVIKPPTRIYGMICFINNMVFTKISCVNAVQPPDGLHDSYLPYSFLKNFLLIHSTIIPAPIAKTNDATIRIIAYCTPNKLNDMMTINGFSSGAAMMNVIIVRNEHLCFITSIKGIAPHEHIGSIAP